MQMGDENPRIMYGVIITVYVDRQTTTVRSFQARRKNEGKRLIERTWNREIGRARGYDRRANLLAYIRQMRAESLAGDAKRDGVDVDTDKKTELQNPKKKMKRKWIRKMISKFRLPFLRPFRRKNRTWRYRQFVQDEEEGEAKSKAYNSDFWKKLKHMVGGLSRGCIRSRRHSRRQNGQKVESEK